MVQRRRRKQPAANPEEFRRLLRGAMGPRTPEELSILVVDPSINSCGVAYFDEGRFVDTQIIRSRGASFDDRLASLFDQFREAANERIVNLAVIERPDEWTRTNRPESQHGRSINTGDLMKLAAAVGTIHAAFQAEDIQVVSPTVATWKGMGSKADTAIRVELMTGVRITNNHEADAAGLGLWLLDEARKVPLLPTETKGSA